MNGKVIIISVVLLACMMVFPGLAVEYQINTFLPNIPNHCYIIAGSPWGDGNNFMRFTNSTLANEIIRYNITSINPSECNNHSGTFIGKWSNIQVIHGNFIMNSNGIYLSNIIHDSSVSGAGAQTIEFFYSTGMWYGVHGGNGGGDVYMYMETTAQAPYGWHNATFENGVPPEYCYDENNFHLCLNCLSVARGSYITGNLTTTNADNYYNRLIWGREDGGSNISEVSVTYYYDPGFVGLFGSTWKKVIGTAITPTSINASRGPNSVLYNTVGNGQFRLKISTSSFPIPFFEQVTTIADFRIPITVTNGSSGWNMSGGFNYSYFNNTTGMSGIYEQIHNYSDMPGHLPWVNTVPGRSYFDGLIQNNTIFSFMSGWYDICDSVLEPVNATGIFIFGTILSPLTIIGNLIGTAGDYFHIYASEMMGYISPLGWLFNATFAAIPSKVLAVASFGIIMDLVKQFLRAEIS